MKAIVLSLLISAPVFSQNNSIVTTIDSYEASENPLQELAAQFALDKDFAGKVIDVCVNGECVVVDRTVPFEKGGMPETIASSEWSRDVATVVKAATGGVSGSAQVKVTVTHKETNKDGSSKETKVEVDVTVKGQK